LAGYGGDFLLEYFFVVCLLQPLAALLLLSAERFPFLEDFNLSFPDLVYLDFLPLFFEPLRERFPDFLEPLRERLVERFANLPDLCLRYDFLDAMVIY
jgi:hypothetical protein